MQINNTGSIGIKFKNEYIVYETYIKCNIKNTEFNLTYNPTILDNINNISGSIKAFATGSKFNPYITTIGLYNNNNELLAVAKLGQPIKLSENIDNTIIIKYE